MIFLGQTEGTMAVGVVKELYPSSTYDYAILIDFEATCDSNDDELTRLAQCDRHEIIEFVR